MQKSLLVFEQTNLLIGEFDDRFAEIYKELKSQFSQLFEKMAQKSGWSKKSTKGVSEKPQLNSTNLIQNDAAIEKEQKEFVEKFAKDTSEKNQKTVFTDFSVDQKNEVANVSEKWKMQELANGLQGNSEINKTWMRENHFLRSFSTTEFGVLLRDVGYRQMSENGLTENIKEWFVLKKVNDSNNLESHYPRQTMEQFLYSHLKKKLNNECLVVERVLSITLAINEFSANNNEIAIFGLVV